ncbi:MAG: hypothetical protein GF350_15895 [Chitinivibrionales bacterium]|nr:hypothetical protein [Chitinivibrionales bacterium]
MEQRNLLHLKKTDKISRLSVFAVYLSDEDEVEVVKDEWIETAKEMGREIPEPIGRLKYA